MKHVVRAMAPILFALAAAGCSQGDPTGPPSPTAVASAPISVVTPASSSITSEIPTSAPPSATTTQAASTPTPAVAPSAVTVAEADGWRLAITRPEPGATVNQSATICYQASGSTRESSVAFDVSAMPSGSSSGAVPKRLPATIGAGSVTVDLSDAPPAPFDLRIGLVGDGQVVAGVVVTIPGLLVGDAPRVVDCP
jgi:hypothetical protein